MEAGGQGKGEIGPSHPQVSEGPDSPDGKTWVCTLWRKERSEALGGRQHRHRLLFLLLKGATQAGLRLPPKAYSAALLGVGLSRPAGGSKPLPPGL